MMKMTDEYRIVDTKQYNLLIMCFIVHSESQIRGTGAVTLFQVEVVASYLLT